MSDNENENKKPILRKVEKFDDDIRLDKWVKQYYPEITFGLMQKLLRKGGIKIDGKKAKPDDRLKVGQEVRIPVVDAEDSGNPRPVRKPSSATPAQAQEYLIDNILFENSNLTIINKPPGLPVQGGSKVTMCVDDMLRYLGTKEEKFKLVHRIDKDTSGILMLAHDVKSANIAGKEFFAKAFRKTYWALVVGVPALKEGVIDLPLGPVAGAGGAEKMQVDKKDGKRAITYYKVVENLSQDLCWIAMQPVTGRKHQLRAHMHAIGHPIVGDGKYAGREAHVDGISKKMHLHARRIEHDDFMGTKLDVSAPLPRHMRESWKLFEFDTNNREEYFDRLG
jgi:23S rRNA pseudouridine955/2504/2580 synthase